jgi:hypothetical protein
MARRTLEDIDTELVGSICKGLIYNARYKELSDDANRLLYRATSDEALLGLRRDKMWGNSHVAINQLFYSVPGSVLHVSGWLKRADKHKDYHAISAHIEALKPYAHIAELLKAAKPLIVKGREPAIKTEAQLAAMAAKVGKAKTCQICGRPIFAGRGFIAHHGYTRPQYGSGVQTSSCWGARHLPFEQSRDELGVYLVHLGTILQSLQVTKSVLDTGDAPLLIMVAKIDGQGAKMRDSFGDLITESVHITPADSRYAKRLAVLTNENDSMIRMISDDIAQQQKRYDNWKPEK